jgi:signal peptidase complex subunit 3
MHSFWARLNAVIFFGLYSLGVLASLCAFSTYLHDATPSVTTLRVNNLRSLKVHNGVDRAMLSFDINADLRSVFNWNTKQLFCFVVVEYKSKSNELNQVVVFDKIVQKKEDAHLKYKNVFNKYVLVDQYDELRGTDLKLKLVWDIMPLSGRLFMHSRLSRTNFQLPSVYK